MLAALFALLLFIVPVQSVAADGPHRPTGPNSRSASAPPPHTPKGAAVVRQASSILCYLTADYPHISTSPGSYGHTIAVGHDDCNGIVNHIAIQTVLWYSLTGSGWSIVADSGTVNFYSTQTSRAVADQPPCVTGFYQNESTDYIEFPAGYYPSPQGGPAWSDVRTISCP